MFALLRSVLVNGLRTRFDGINILSEETNPRPQIITTKNSAANVAKKLENDPMLDLSKILVTVDPLDATKVSARESIPQPNCCAS